MFLRFKEYVILEYKQNNTLLKKGTELFEIEDPQKKIFSILETKRWKSGKIPNELEVFLKENNLVIEEYNIPPENIFSKNLFYFENRAPNFKMSPLILQKKNK